MSSLLPSVHSYQTPIPSIVREARERAAGVTGLRNSLYLGWRASSFAWYRSTCSLKAATSSPNLPMRRNDGLLERLHVNPSIEMSRSARPRRGLGRIGPPQRDSAAPGTKATALVRTESQSAQWARPPEGCCGHGSGSCRGCGVGFGFLWRKAVGLEHDRDTAAFYADDTS